MRDASNRARLVSNVATEVSQMVSPPTQTAKSTPPARKPTEYLTQVKIEQLSQLSIFLLAREGFSLKDVQAMLSVSELYLSSSFGTQRLAEEWLDRPCNHLAGNAPLNLSITLLGFRLSRTTYSGLSQGFTNDLPVSDYVD